MSGTAGRRKRGSAWVTRERNAVPERAERRRRGGEEAGVEGGAKRRA